MKTLSFLIILLTIFSPMVVRAEGSKELTQHGGSRPFLDDRSDFFNGIPRRNLIKVYVQAGETLQLGSSAVGIGTNGNIIATAPDGTVLNCKTSQPGKGFIANRAQELAGPGDGTGGTFIPCSTTVTAAQAGIWEIRFRAPSLGTTDPPITNANVNWPAQGAGNAFVAAWDVTVRNSAGQVQPGRAFANSLALNTNFTLGQPVPSVNSRLFVQTQDGYLYNVNLNGLEPVGFIFFSNKNGFIHTSGPKLGEPLYKSVDAPNTATNLTNPPSDDNFTHKLFFNQPDSILPTTANSPSGLTWLKPITVLPPQPTNLKFFGKEGTENQTGTNPLQGTFKFDAPEARPFTIAVDVNDNGSFNDPIDRVIIGTAKVGTNNVPWDGKDGLGNDVPPSALGYRAQVKLYGGQVHFPLFDPERNPNGLIINRITPVAGVAGDPTYNSDWMYYDDSGFYNPGPPVAPNPIRLLTGGSSSSGIHQFGGSQPAGPPYTRPNSQTYPDIWWGNSRGIDTWAFVPSLPVELNDRIRVLRADLSITKILTSPNTTPGNPISYAIIVRNAGPSNVTGVKVEDIFPAAITSPTWTCAITTGTGACPTPSGSGNIDTTVDLNAGAVATFTVNGTLSSGATGAISNSAKITRPNDVADPVDQDRSGGDNTTETATTTYGGLGIAKQAGTVTANADGSFSIPYTLVITNTTTVPFTNLQVTEDLKATFGNSPFTIQSLTSPSGLTVNPSFNGDSDKNLLAGTDTLPANTTATINLTVKVMPTNTAPPYQNTARVSGRLPEGVEVTDDSTNGSNPDPDGNGNPTDNSVPTVVNFNIPRLGIAKAAGTPVNNNNGTYTIPYTLVVKNMGNVAISNLQVTDNLSTTFGAVPFSIEPGSISSPTLTVNTSFNGSTVQNLLAGSNTLAVGQTAQISFNVRITPGTNNGPFNNTATANGNTSAGPVSDVSTDGNNPDPDGDGNPNNNNQQTVVNIPRLGIAKAAGTPVNNNDGTYTIPYTLVVKNMGNVAINSLQVTDDLSTTFGSLPFSIQSISSPSLAVNNSFTGRSPNQNLLQGTDTLAVGAEAEITFNVLITPGSSLGPFDNTATANGNTSAGPVSDASTDGSNPDPDGDGNPGNNSSPTSVGIAGISNLRLVKRVTRVNEILLTDVVDDLSDPNDNAPSWPSGYLQGEINVPNVSPGDTVEYTIYFLSDGNVPANDVKICDRIPANQTFVPDGFAPVSGSAVQFGTNTPTFLTNANDSDFGTFFPVGTTIDANLCSGANTNGALIWNLGNIPNNANPINYGFVRFRAKVK